MSSHMSAAMAITGYLSYSILPPIRMFGPPPHRPRLESRSPHMATVAANLSDRPCACEPARACSSSRHEHAMVKTCCWPFGLAQQCEHALLLGDARDLWFVGRHWRFGGGDPLGLFNRPRRNLGVGRGGDDFAPGCRLRLGVPLLGGGALGVPGLRDGKGRHGFGLPWFAAPELTLARPKVP